MDNHYRGPLDPGRVSADIKNGDDYSPIGGCLKIVAAYTLAAVVFVLAVLPS